MMSTQVISFLLLVLFYSTSAFQYYPSRTVPSSWFQDSSKYLQPITDTEHLENVSPDHEDLDIAASEFNNEHIDRMATDLKRGQLERMSSGQVEARGDQMAAALGDNTAGRVQIKVYRGPDSGGDHDEKFAPYGYWVKQPADYDHH